MMRLVILIMIILITKLDECYFYRSNFLKSNFYVSKFQINNFISTEFIYFSTFREEFVGIFQKTPWLPFLLLLYVIGNAGKVSF